MPTKSARPSARIASASAGLTMRPVANTGVPVSTRRIAAAGCT